MLVYTYYFTGNDRQAQEIPCLTLISNASNSFVHCTLQLAKCLVCQTVTSQLKHGHQTNRNGRFKLTHSLKTDLGSSRVNTYFVRNMSRSISYIL
jgi:hypothetical protein